MNFQTRKSEAKELVIDFLSTMAPPRGVPDSGLASIIDFISDAFARKMPVKGDYREAVSAVLMRLRDTHMSNTWPPQAAFVMAMPAGESMGRPAPESFRVADPVAHYTNLMREGLAIPETVIWGVIASELPKHELERYRNASVMAWIDVYRESAGRKMIGRYGDVVAPYFPAQRAAE